MSLFNKTTNPVLSLLVGLVMLSGCSDESSNSQKPELLVYCGITMIKPMSEIARIIEEEQNVSISFSQGGSEDLYQSLKTSKKGDLYLPGSASYRKRHLEDGLLGEFVHVGYNQAALMVHKGNPKQLNDGLPDLLRKDINVVICNPESGSIGRESKRILESAGIYEQVMQNTVYLTTDSRNLNGALKKHDADLILNWRATAFFDENKEFMDVIDLDPKIAKPKKLLLNLLTFSQHPEVARRYMEYASSPEGQAIFRKYGFLDNTTPLE
jgi:molybdate transport system substrate-binding protein